MMEERLLRQFSEAMLAHELGLVYQPIVCIETGHVLMLEALLDWPELKEFGISVSQMFEILERNPVLARIYDRYAFEHAMRDLTVLIACTRYSGRMSVNFSAATLQGHSIEPFVRQIFKIYPSLTSSKVMVEITERREWQGNLTVLSNLKSLRKFGVEIALDEFMNGFATFNSLLCSEISYVKVDYGYSKQDRSRVRDAITETVCDVCKKTNKIPIVQGIESQSDLEYFLRYGYTLFQGVHFSKPLNLKDVARYIVSVRPRVAHSN